MPQHPLSIGSGRRRTRGSVGYFAPRPRWMVRRYHFQIFALDTVLTVPPGADRDALLLAMKGHVLAKGELVGRYRQGIKPLK